MTKIELTCEVCDKTFLRNKGEWNRSQKLGRKDFCSRKCSCIYGNKVRPNRGNVANLIPNNARDEFTPFRFYIKVSKCRTKSKEKFFEMNLSLEYLKDLWEAQNGKCILSGVDLVLPKNCDRFGYTGPNKASLDRINNSLGYVKGNVRFISYIANIARNGFTDEELIEFCKAVVNQQDKEQK